MGIDTSKFLVAFNAEAKERLEKLNKGILDLEKNPKDTDVLDTLMKEAHTVKGSASMMGFRLIADLAHKMEDGFEAAPDRETSFSPSDCDLLFECLDTIESLLEGVLQGKAKALDEAYVANSLRHSEKKGAWTSPPPHRRSFRPRWMKRPWQVARPWARRPTWMMKDRPARCGENASGLHRERSR